MADRSKFFRVAVEGATTDGRVIERSLIEEMAATYNPATYGARVNMEHIRGFSPEPPFNAYGDVLAVKAEEVTIELAGKQVKRLALFAQIAPTDELVKLNTAKQKLYTSIEINPNFAATGKAYLMGLAVTDSPASLGTELLAFAAGGTAEAAHVKAALDARKMAPGNLFTAAAETFSLELEAAPGAPGALVSAAEVTLSGLIAGVMQKLTGAPAVTTAVAATSPVAATAPALAAPSPGGQGGDFAAFAAQITGLIAAQGQAFATGFDQIRAADQAAFNVLKGEVTGLKAIADGTAKHSGRPVSTGAPAIVQTDC